MPEIENNPDEEGLIDSGRPLAGGMGEATPGMGDDIGDWDVESRRNLSLSGVRQLAGRHISTKLILLLVPALLITFGVLGFVAGFLLARRAGARGAP